MTLVSKLAKIWLNINLANELNVLYIEPGRIKKVDVSPNEVLDALARHNLVIEMYDRTTGPKPGVYYFQADGRIFGAVQAPSVEYSRHSPKKNASPEMIGLPRKPEGYKDGHRLCYDAP